MKHPRILLGAVSSNTGKTTITCAILQALKNRGMKLASFKCGPDYLDPLFHTQALGVKSWNLDPFFTEEDTLNALLQEHASGVDFSVIEGVMGYFDGLGGTSLQASTCQVAQITETPAVLLVSCKGLSLSMVAMIQGFLEYAKPNQIQGVILNQISPMLYPSMQEKIQSELGVRVYGYFPLCPDLSLPSRRLGLIPAEELEQISALLQGLAAQAEKTLDLDGLLALGQSAPPCTAPSIRLPLPKTPGISPKIAVARDPAFCFLYPDNLELLEKLGATLCFFSPLTDSCLPDCDGLLLPGGYPELYASTLSQNESMKASIHLAWTQGMPCVAEGGGFLYLHQSLTDADGNAFPMVGTISAACYPTDRLQRFGYIRLTAQKDQIFGSAQTAIPAHEFHYWESSNPGADFVAAKPAGNRSWTCVHASSTQYAGFPHLYWYGNPSFAVGFYDACCNHHFAKRRKKELI